MNYKSSYFILTCLGFGFAFLYIPILSMVVFSFNASKLVTVWDTANSPTLKWYYALLDNEEILDAAWISVKVAVINASGAVILGTLAGFSLARFSHFRGRFTLNGDTVTHHVEISSIQNFVNKDLVRSVKFQNDRIVLVTPPAPVNGEIQTVELTWQRLPATH